jgi:hypothetical protein
MNTQANARTIPKLIGQFTPLAAASLALLVAGCGGTRQTPARLTRLKRPADRPRPRGGPERHRPE